MPNCTGWHQVRRVLPAASLYGASCFVAAVARLDKTDHLLQTLRQFLHLLVRRGVRSRVPQVGLMPFTEGFHSSFSTGDAAVPAVVASKLASALSFDLQRIDKEGFIFERLITGLSLSSEQDSSPSVSRIESPGFNPLRKLCRLHSYITTSHPSATSWMLSLQQAKLARLVFRAASPG